MIEVAEEIYNTLTGVTQEVYFNMLPENPDASRLLIVYELNESESFSAMDVSDYANTLSLSVKILHPDSMELLRVGKQIKGLLLNQEFKYNRGIEYENSVPVFPDRDLNSSQFTLNFSLYVSN